MSTMAHGIVYTFCHVYPSFLWFQGPNDGAQLAISCQSTPCAGHHFLMLMSRWMKRLEPISSLLKQDVKIECLIGSTFQVRFVHRLPWYELWPYTLQVGDSCLPETARQTANDVIIMRIEQQNRLKKYTANHRLFCCIAWVNGAWSVSVKRAFNQTITGFRDHSFSLMRGKFGQSARRPSPVVSSNSWPCHVLNKMLIDIVWLGLFF